MAGSGGAGQGPGLREEGRWNLTGREVAGPEPGWLRGALLDLADNKNNAKGSSSFGGGKFLENTYPELFVNVPS
jgi:hypothetical protein